MALDSHSFRFLLGCHSLNVNFESSATLGCQSLNPNDCGPERITPLFEKYHLNFPEAPLSSASLFKSLGCKQFAEIDVSDYEGATVIQNLNLPIPKELEERFDVVYDGGSLEHVFNVAEGLRNCMKMVKVGGHFIAQSPANNWFGHGFYQFSPEFFYRAFSSANGFKISRVMAYDLASGDEWFEVRDPDAVGHRIEQFGPFRVMLLILAQRVSVQPIFEPWPSQSDYATAWARDSSQEMASSTSATGLRSISKRFTKILPTFSKKAIRRHLGGILHGKYSFKNPAHFKKVSDF